ncbi:RdgB/HAM1 family non-canonical purine NTP pyrophosphatase [Alteromonas sediminis]|uniref:dITP/XTP pyrophosphatase n=1 Tax=Alteromonas sediminis TaxID=2259342 RepID=A0A3N5Y5D6_9ALTE|nr:RdgB/HAM1 family non-canonical purine NTP pyrophosphatase [Alteromonas sediminis]
MKQLVLASGNAGKIREFSQIFSAWQVDVIAQTACGVSSVPETGTTFVENAIIKARHAAKETGLPALADDSGLVVNALKGAPGIFSSRYAGVDASDTDNVNKLLDAMEGMTDRKAHFQCVLVFMRHADDPIPVIAQGQWHGEIALTPHGEGGFGYDPVFWLPEQSCTAAQLDKKTKNTISHRGQAVTLLREKMSQLLG